MARISNPPPIKATVIPGPQPHQPDSAPSTGERNTIRPPRDTATRSVMSQCVIAFPGTISTHHVGQRGYTRKEVGSRDSWLQTTRTSISKTFEIHLFEVKRIVVEASCCKVIVKVRPATITLLWVTRPVVLTIGMAFRQITRWCRNIYSQRIHRL